MFTFYGKKKKKRVEIGSGSFFYSAPAGTRKKYVTNRPPIQGSLRKPVTGRPRPVPGLRLRCAACPVQLPSGSVFVWSLRCIYIYNLLRLLLGRGLSFFFSHSLLLFPVFLFACLFCANYCASIQDKIIYNHKKMLILRNEIREKQKMLCYTVDDCRNGFY